MQIKETTVWNSKSLMEDVSIKGKLAINGTLNLNGHTLRVQEDLISKANIEFGMGGRLIVGGDFYQLKGALEVRNGLISVKGNFLICDMDEYGNRISGVGSIYDTKDSRINVGKEFYYDSLCVISLQGIYNFEDNVISRPIARNWYGSVNLCGKNQFIDIGNGKIKKLNYKFGE